MQPSMQSRKSGASACSRCCKLDLQCQRRSLLLSLSERERQSMLMWARVAVASKTANDHGYAPTLIDALLPLDIHEEEACGSPSVDCLLHCV